MSDEYSTVETEQTPTDEVLEKQRLVACYEHASAYERQIVWAVLNKYAPLVSI